MKQMTIKSLPEIELMQQGGKKLARIKNTLKDSIREGISAWEIEKIANSLIEQTGATASFKMIPGYSWATCININEGLVHGIPKAEVIFKKGDIVSVDVGVFYKGFHTDTSFSLAIDGSEESKDFLQAGNEALEKAIGEAFIGNRIYDISKVIEETVEKSGFSPIRALVGHGIGSALHEEPQIPCFTYGERSASPEIREGMVLAIEVMYAYGKPDVVTSVDGWTIVMADGKISALFEETVAVTTHGPVVLTA